MDNTKKQLDCKT